MERSASPKGIGDRIWENLAKLVASVSALIVFIGWSYYSTLFEHFGLSPSILDISQAERISMGVVSMAASLSLAATLLFLLIVGLAFALMGVGVGIRVIGKRRGWRWVEMLLKWQDGPAAAAGVIDWLFRVSIACLVAGLALGAGRYAGNYDAQAFHARVLAGLGCDYRFEKDSLHGVLLGQDQTRTLILTSTGVRVMLNKNFKGVGPTTTGCLDRLPTRRASRPTAAPVPKSS
jgi:hypothetical protein